MKNKWIKICAVIMLVAFVVTGILPIALANETDEQIAAYQRQQQELQQIIQDAKKNVNNTVIEKNKVLGQLKAINDDIDDINIAISQLDVEISEAEVQIDATQMEIDNKQRDLEGRMAIFSTRLKEIYQYGDVDFLEVLMQASDLTDFLSRFEYLRYIAENDQKLLEEVTALKQSLEDQKAVLVAQKEDLETKKKSHETKINELEIAGQEKEVIAAQIQDELDLQYAALDAVEEESNKIASQIRRLQTSSGKAPSALAWPCPSSKRITSDYGPRVHPIKKTKSTHTGIDIGASSGSAIEAAADGTVIAAAYNSAYGYYIIVDHGGGLSTMYAHMSAFISKEGDVVTTGQPIGKVGSTGLSTGPHLHFEVRVNGAHTNPRPYLNI